MEPRPPSLILVLITGGAAEETDQVDACEHEAGAVDPARAVDPLQVVDDGLGRGRAVAERVDEVAPPLLFEFG